MSSGFKTHAIVSEVPLMYSRCCDRSRVVGCLIRFSVSVRIEFDEVWVVVYFLENTFQVSSFI